MGAGALPVTLIFCLLRSTLAACKEVGVAASWPPKNHKRNQHAAAAGLTS